MTPADATGPVGESTILRVERLRDELEQLRTEMQRRFAKGRSVTSVDLRDTAARLAEAWMLEVKRADGVRSGLESNVLAELDVEFQRLLSYSEHNTLRKKYDTVLRAILKDFRSDVIVPLKASRGARSAPQGAVGGSVPAPPLRDARSVFLAHSFAEDDEQTAETVKQMLNALGLEVLTGQRARAERISEKVKGRIEDADAFVGLFTRGDKVAGRKEWATSAWIVDEKAHAFSKGKRLVILKEEGVTSIGGLQGDYEYIEFDRGDLVEALIKLVEVFRDAR